MNTLRAGIVCLSLLSVSTLSALYPRAHQENKDKPACSSKNMGRCGTSRVGGNVSLGLDYFHGLPDGSWPGNFGAFAAIDFATRISNETYGFGAQVGGSYGYYDWDGRGSNSSGNTKAMQQQGFLTVGLFRQAPACSGFSGGIVYDFMFNKQFSVFALSPIIEQLRAQVGYLFKSGDEIGIWATVNTNISHREASEVPIQFRAISQANFFWRHYFKNQSQLQLWVGTPYRHGLMNESGRPGRYIIGGSVQAPISQSFSLFGRGVYMAPNSASPFQESRLFGANVCFGLNYSFGGCKAGERPYLPLANNSNFLVDTNFTQ